VDFVGDYILNPNYNNLQILQFNPVGMYSEQTSIPLDINVAGNYPNPFNSSTLIKFTLTEPANINIEVYDVLGRKVDTINGGHKTAGTHSLSWNSDSVASGIYFFKVISGEYAKIVSGTLLK